MKVLEEDALYGIMIWFGWTKPCEKFVLAVLVIFLLLAIGQTDYKSILYGGVSLDTWSCGSTSRGMRLFPCSFELSLGCLLQICSSSNYSANVACFNFLLVELFKFSYLLFLLSTFFVCLFLFVCFTWLCNNWNSVRYYQICIEKNP